MNIDFKLIHADDFYAFKLIEKWDNNEEIKYFIRPNFNNGEIKLSSATDMQDNFKLTSDKYIYLIIFDEIEVGYVSFEINFNQFYKKVDNSAWISICIGEKKYRSIGIGEIAIKFIEEKCRNLKCSRIELGVFEFNKNAYSFYSKLGYIQIAEINDFTFYKGKWQKDIRMEKFI